MISYILIELSFQRDDLRLQSADFIRQLRHSAMVIVSLRPQICQLLVQFLVLGGCVAPTPLFKVKFRFKVTHLIRRYMHLICDSVYSVEITCTQSM